MIVEDLQVEEISQIASLNLIKFEIMWDKTNTFFKLDTHIVCDSEH